MKGKVKLQTGGGAYYSWIGQMLYALIKRLFDIVASLVGLVVLVPVCIVIKICYLVGGDFYPIIYSQTRVGKNGKKFKIYKFRSMVWDAEKQLEDLLKQEKYKKQWAEFQKLDDDPRITKVGKIIRRGSIDEMPQFLNVLIGQMSMVGPRPLVPGEIEEHRGDQKKYCSVKPGMTGYWATRGRSDNDYEDRLKMEYYYAENRGLMLDMKILARTVKIVLVGSGAK